VNNSQKLFKFLRYTFLSMVVILGLVTIIGTGGSSNGDGSGNGNNGNGGKGDALTEGDFINSLGMAFNYIEPGTFMMGSPEDEPGRREDERRQQEVTLTQGYYMQTTPVTQGQWVAVMGSNPSHFDECGTDCPVDSVSRNSAEDFIAALNDLEDTDRYALPTEAQWEYAARAGSTTAFANGEITETGDGYDPVLDSMGWYYYNSQVDYDSRWGAGRGTHPVAQKEPNAWGLYDMHGNIWEWVSDWYDSGEIHAVARGGGFRSTARDCRSGYRTDGSPSARSFNNGFRIVRLPSD